ncbi:MAG: hypothetical protein KDN19_03080 [Verrucomicrobiae bacterium]|nr:hypothetical protein [Verrucomicrobiae bacterium]
MKLSLFSILSAILLLEITPSAMALNPVVNKLHGRAETTQLENLFGGSVAATDKWVVVGEPSNDDLGQDAGAVHVYSAVTGRYLRQLVGAEVAGGFEFGYSVAVCGDTAVVGAPNDNAGGVTSGAVYVFNLRNGRQLLRIEAETPIASSQYGRSVAISHDHILVGAPQPGSGTGRAYLVDRVTGEELWEITAADAASGDRFAWSVALCGNLGMVGAPLGDSDTVVNCGSAYLFDLAGQAQLYECNADDATANTGYGSAISLGGGCAVIGAPRDGEGGNEAGAAYVVELISGAELRKLISAEAADFCRFGNAVSISGAMVLIGENQSSVPYDPDDEPLSKIGSALLFDLYTGAELQRFVASDADFGDEFGTAVALSGDLVAIGSPFDDDIEMDCGSVYLWRGLSSVRPFTTLAKVGDFAPGAPETDFRYFGQPLLPVGLATSFEAGLMGPGSHGNRDKGVWGELDGTRKLVSSNRDLGSLGAEWDGIMVNSTLGITTASSYTAVTVSLKGTGVTGANNRAVLRTYPNLATVAFARTGDSPAVLNGTQLATFQDVVGFAAGGGIGIPCILKNGVGGVNAGNNSGVYATGVFERFLREGDGFATSQLRQFFGRFAGHTSGAFGTFGAHHVPDGEVAARQGLFNFLSNTSASDSILVSQNDPEPDNSAQSFRSFLGESKGLLNDTAIKATVSGAGVNGSNNEGLWLTSGPSLVPGVREGQEPDPVNLPGVVYSRVLKYWAVNSGAIAHVLLRGKGVNGANDGALVHVSSMTGDSVIFLREGDPVCDGDGPRIRAFQRIEVERTSRKYAVVASLTGAASKNQALLMGNLAPADPALWAPSMKLRKGTLFQAPGGDTTRLRSIDFRPVIDRTGSGANGGDQVMSFSGKAIMCLNFDNRVKELVTMILIP